MLRECLRPNVGDLQLISRSRRSAHRWATPTAAPESQTDEKVTALSKEPHPIENLVASLLEPTDIEQKEKDYDWYIRYPTTDLSTQALGEEKDLKLYVRAVRLTEGEGVDNLLSTSVPMSNPQVPWGGEGWGAAGTAGGVAGGPTGTSGGNEDGKGSAAYYEAWLKA